MSSLFSVVPPNEQEDAPMLKKLQAISKFVLRADAREIFQKLSGYTIIQGGRAEIFLHSIVNEFGQTIPPEAGQWICSQCGVSPQQLIDYAIQQAQKDPRGQNIDFSVFSFIVNFGPVLAQDLHLDSIWPNVQAAMIVSDRVKGTKIFDTNYPVKTVRTTRFILRYEIGYSESVSHMLFFLLGVNDAAMQPSQLQRCWPDVPESLLSVLESNKTVINLLNDYGKVFCNSLTKASNEKILHPTGTVLLQHGSTLHAAPRCTGPRIILFYSGSPKGYKRAYNPNVQYSASTLLCELIRHVWNDANPDSRRFLLTKVADYCANASGNLSERLAGNPVSFFCQLVRGKQNKKTLTKAMDEFLFYYPTFPRPGIVSVEGLKTIQNSKVLTFTVYDTMEVEGDEQQGQFEGTLVMNDGAEWELFDGTNGKFYDQDGVEVKCFVPDEGSK